MATPEIRQQLFTATANECQQYNSNVMKEPSPSKEYRKYNTQIQNMIKDGTWYLLGNKNWVPPIEEYVKRYDINR